MKNIICCFLLFLAGAITAFSQVPPIKDFRLPNDELVTIFIGENNWQAPYFQCVDFFNDNFIFRNLCENASQSVDHGSGAYYEIDAANGNFDGINETIEIITCTRNNNNFIFQHAFCDQNGIRQVNTLNSTITHAAHPRIVSGYFTPEAINDKREELVIASSYDDRYIRFHGFRFSTAGTEQINRFSNKELQLTDYMSPVDITVCDYDGDNYDEVCYTYVVYDKYFMGLPPNTTQYCQEEIIIGSFDWTPQGENPIAFPFGSPQKKIIKSWSRSASDFFSPADLFTSAHLFRISAGDINNDGSDEVAIFRDLRYTGGRPPDAPKSGFDVCVFSYEYDTKKWSQEKFDNMSGTLLDEDTPFTNIETRKNEYDNIQLNVEDIDNNGCCDIAASLTYKTSTKEAMHYWLYTFRLDAIEGLVAKEELNDKKDNTGLKHAMEITNMDGDKYGEIYFVTDLPKLYAITYDTTRKEFKAIEEKSTSSNNYNSSAHGFIWPVILPMDIDNDSYWCRYKAEMFDSQNATPFIGKPVAIITPPPYEKDINDQNTFIEIKFNTMHDTSASVQTQTGYGYDFEISAGVKWLGTKTVFETTYRDTVKNKKEYFEGNSDNDYWTCQNSATQVVFPTAGYDIFPFRIENFLGEPIKSNSGKALFLYTLKPKDSGTHLEMYTWENYLDAFEESYGSTEKDVLVGFMSDFMKHESGDVSSYMSNANPYFLYNNLNKVFPTLEQPISTAFNNYKKEWGKTTRADESCTRSQKWENKIDIKTGKDWGIINAGAHLKFNNFTSTKEMTGSTTEDGIIININFGGVGEPNVDEDKYYRVMTYAFWGPEDIGLNSAVIIAHQVTEVGSYYNPTIANNEQNRLPTNFTICQNYPNPFNPTTTINYQVPKNSPIKLTIYNTLGQVVTLLVDRQQSPGYYNVIWDARNQPSGLYIYRLEADGFAASKKMFLVK